MTTTTPMLDLVTTAYARGQIATVANLVYAAAQMHEDRPVRQAMLMDALALIEAVRDEIGAETIEAAANLATRRGIPMP